MSSTTDESNIGDCARRLSELEVAKLGENGVLMSEFKRKKLSQEAAANWDKFYKRNETRFFKDRHWSLHEFPRLLHEFDFTRQFVLFEAGCGVGNFLFPFLEYFPSCKAYGCDFSPRAVDFVKSCASYDENRCCVFVCDLTEKKSTDLLRQPFLSAQSDSLIKVDICTLIFVLSAVPPQKMVTLIENLTSVLTAGESVVVVRDYGLYDHAMLRFDKGRKIDEQFYARQDGTMAYYFSQEQLKGLFESSGRFETLHCCFRMSTTTNRAKELKATRVFVEAVFRFQR